MGKTNINDNLLGYNLEKELKARNMTITELSKITGISRVTLTNIKKGRIKPRIETLQEIMRGFGLSHDELIKNNTFDCDYFLQVLSKKYNPEAHISENDPQYDNPDYYGPSLMEYLVFEFGMDPFSIIKKQMPEEEVQKRIIKGFNLSKEEAIDLFRPLSTMHYLTKSNNVLFKMERADILSSAEYDYNKMLILFNELDYSSQKTVYNLICDLYLSKHKDDY